MGLAPVGKCCADCSKLKRVTLARNSLECVYETPPLQMEIAVRSNVCRFVKCAGKGIGAEHA